MDNVSREGMRYRVIVDANSPAGQLVSLVTSERTAGPTPHPILDCNVAELRHPYYIRVGVENPDEVGKNVIYHLPHGSIVAIQEYDHHWDPSSKIGFHAVREAR